MLNTKLKLWLIGCLFLLTACDSGQSDPSYDKLKSDLLKTVIDAQGHFDKLKPKAKELKDGASGLGQDANAEFEKLMRFEYQIAEIKRGDLAEVQKKLESLGQERWDCFHVEPTKDTWLLFCKRAPKTYLRYLLKLF